MFRRKRPICFPFSQRQCLGSILIIRGHRGVVNLSYYCSWNREGSLCRICYCCFPLQFSVPLSDVVVLQSSDVKVLVNTRFQESQIPNRIQLFQPPVELHRAHPVPASHSPIPCHWTGQVQLGQTKIQINSINLRIERYPQNSKVKSINPINHPTHTLLIHLQ